MNSSSKGLFFFLKDLFSGNTGSNARETMAPGTLDTRDTLHGSAP